MNAANFSAVLESTNTDGPCDYPAPFFFVLPSFRERLGCAEPRIRAGGRQATLNSYRINAAVYCKESTRGIYRAREPIARHQVVTTNCKLASQNLVRIYSLLYEACLPPEVALPCYSKRQKRSISTPSSGLYGKRNSVAPFSAERTSAHCEQHLSSTSIAPDYH